MSNITSENSIDADEAARDVAENSNTDDQIFENVTADDNLSNLEIRDAHATDKSNVRRSNRLTEIENSLIKMNREKNTAAFAAIDETSIEKE